MAEIKNIWIGLLDIEQKDEIRNKLYKALQERGITDESEFNFLLAEGMDSRLGDLEEVIDIYNLEHTKIIKC